MASKARRSRPVLLPVAEQEQLRDLAEEFPELRADAQPYLRGPWQDATLGRRIQAIRDATGDATPAEVERRYRTSRRTLRSVRPDDRQAVEPVDSPKVSTDPTPAARGKAARMDAIARVVEASEAADRAAAALAEARERLAQAARDAVTARCPRAQVAKAAGRTRDWVYAVAPIDDF